MTETFKQALKGMLKTLTDAEARDKKDAEEQRDAIDVTGQSRRLREVWRVETAKLNKHREEIFGLTSNKRR